MKYLGIFIFLFVFLTAAEHSNKGVKPMDYDKELKQIKADLDEADRRNHLLQEATATDKQVELIKRKLKRDAR